MAASISRNAREAARLFAAALSHHQRGQVAEAERLYDQALAADPHHAGALHYAGVAALQGGRPDQAAARIERSIAAEGRNAEAHYHLGLAYASLGQFGKCADANRRAVALKADYAEAHMNLGNALNALGRADEAAACYERVIALRPQLADAHYNLANILADQRRFEAANRAYESALAQRPDFPQARQNYGAALLQQKRIDEAIAQFDAVLRAQPGFSKALIGRAQAALTKGAPHEALAAVSRALDTDQGNDAKLTFAASVSAMSGYVPAPRLEERLIAALTEAWGRPSLMTAFVTDMILSHPPVADIERRLDAGEHLALPELETLAAVPLLRALLETTPVASVRLERVMAAARRILLDSTGAGVSLPDDALGFAVALARQCYINEYVFDVAEDEQAQVDALARRVASGLEAGTPPEPLALAVLVAYVPLGALERGRELLGHAWPQAVDALLTQQLREPTIERALCAAMPRLTPIDDEISISVRQQYEENPYPRWVKLSRLRQPEPLDAFIRKQHADAPYMPLGKAVCDILVAGCGTGRQALDLATAIKDANILAVDLSLASLSHAQRKATEASIGNVDFGQADILKLDTLGRTFDVVASSGVLHHMRDPFDAWQRLWRLVRPGGLMMIGLYSETARRHVVAARAFIAERGYSSTPSGIRSARRALLAQPEGAAVRHVLRLTDFFSTSECRDLVFHVQEHRVTIPQIKRFIEENGARFLAFDVAPQVAAHYAARYPEDTGRTDLDRWHEFETENSDTFVGMYQFLIQRPAAPVSLSARP
jgi:tetratricopeptide (TPR) repeat protein/2-polyprenyl-3-methyl-5-hydroxy-6-metoxy-1,4-benzoquinol methylase